MLTDSQESENSAVPERFGRTLIKRFVGAVTNLADSGTTLVHKKSGTEMVLFVGRKGDDIIDIQLQRGQGIRQLFVTLFGDSESYQLRINHQHEDVFDQDIEVFLKGYLDPSLKTQIEQNYPRNIGRIRYNEAGNLADFVKFTEIVEQTVIDRKLLEKVVQHDTQSGIYVRKESGRLEGGRKGLLSSVRKLLGK